MTSKGRNTDPEYYRLLARPFLIKILENQKTLTEPLSEQAIKSIQKSQSPEPNITPEIAYHSNVFHYAHNLVGAVERLEEVPIYLRRFPNSRFLSEHGITLHKWLNYHYSNYLVIIVSLYDIGLLLTNAVFMLGIEPRYCNEKSVAKNKLVRKTEVKGILDKLKLAIGDHRDARHLYVHRGRAPSLDFLDQLESFRFTQEAMEDLEMPKQTADLSNPLMNPFIVQDLFKHERRKLVVQVKEQTSSMVDVLVEFFDCLHPVYQVLSENWSDLFESSS